MVIFPVDYRPWSIRKPVDLRLVALCVAGARFMFKNPFDGMKITFK